MQATEGSHEGSGDIDVGSHEQPDDMEDLHVHVHVPPSDMAHEEHVQVSELYNPFHNSYIILDVKCMLHERGGGGGANICDGFGPC